MMTGKLLQALTGAAGTTLFTVVALLVAGAGVTVAVKSRQRMH